MGQEDVGADLDQDALRHARASNSAARWHAGTAPEEVRVSPRDILARARQPIGRVKRNGRVPRTARRGKP